MYGYIYAQWKNIFQKRWFYKKKKLFDALMLCTNWLCFIHFLSHFDVVMWLSYGKNFWFIKTCKKQNYNINFIQQENDIMNMQRNEFYNSINI